MYTYICIYIGFTRPPTAHSIRCAPQDPSGPVFTNWSVVNLSHSVPRPVEFLSFASLTGAVSGPGVQMRLAAQGLAEAGFEAGYEASLVVNVSQAGGVNHSDVPVEVAVEVYIYR